jgi:hypothetical protein
VAFYTLEIIFFGNIFSASFYIPLDKYSLTLESYRLIWYIKNRESHRNGYPQIINCYDILQCLAVTIGG